MNDLVQMVQGRFESVKKRADSEYEDLLTELASVNKPEAIEHYLPTIRQLGFIMSDVESCSVDFDYSIIDGIKTTYKKNRMEEWLKRGDKLEEELKLRMNKIEEDVTSYVEERNKLTEKSLSEHNEVYLRLEAKKNELSTYQDKIVDLCAEYGITTSDIAIDNSSFPLEEWESVYDNSLSYIKSHGINLNPITKFKEYVTDKNVQAICLVLIIILCLTKLLNVVALAFFMVLIYSEVTAKDKMQKFAIMLGLLYNVNPLEMGYMENVEDKNVLSIEEEIDNNPATDELIEWYENELATYESENPEEIIEKDLTQLTKELMKLTSDCEKFKEEYTSKVEAKVNEIDLMIKQLEEKFEEEKNKVKKLGDLRSIHLHYTPKYLLGLKDGIIPEYVDTGLKNIIFKPYPKDPLLMKKFIQCMVVNAYCNVKLPSICVTVCDPNNLGQDLIGLFTKEMDRVFKTTTENMEKVIEAFTEQAQENMRLLRGKDLETYNKECEITGKTAIEYNLVVVLSQANEKDDNSAEALEAFMKYSASCGIFIWVVSEKVYENTYVFNKPFAGVTTPCEIDDVNFVIEFANKYGEEVKESRPPGLPWKEFVDKVFKPEDLWNDTTNEFIKLNPGFVNGDPSNPKYYTLGNSGDIHAVAAGGTGAGKSVFINQLISNLTLRYSPKELRLWLVDFKGSEFSLYLKSEAFPYQLPHLDACLCTSDPDYAKSLFTAIREEADRRYAMLKKLKFRNMVEYNNEMRKQGREDEILTRIIFLVDEFQVIYTKADTKTLESVNTDIILLAKVARACGVHIIFCSQSMKGTISADTLAMFTLRFCLRCDMDVSMQLMGTPFAGNIRQKFGILYTRSLDDEKAELQARFKTPFQKDNAEVERHIKRMAEEATKRGYAENNVIEYDEATKHSIDEVNEFYKEKLYPLMESGDVADSGTIVLGRRMSYSKNKAPENFVLTTESNSNIFATFQNSWDLVNFFNTLKANFDNYKGRYQTIYNAQTEDLHYLCHLDEIVPEPLQLMSTKKTSMVEMVDTFKKIVEKRKETGEKDFPIIFVCLGWTNAVGFGIEPDTRRVTDPLTMLLQTAGEYNIHWVFIGNSKNQTPTSVLKACEYKICGKVDAQTATAVADTNAAYKPVGEIVDGFAFFNRKGDLTKFKLYQSVIDREIKKSEIVI